MDYLLFLSELRNSTGPRLRDLASWPPLVTVASSRNLGIELLPNLERTKTSSDGILHFACQIAFGILSWEHL